MATSEGIRLEFADRRPPLVDLSEVNGRLKEAGAGAWPLSLGGAPEDVRRLLSQPTLTDAEAARVRTLFLLPRERLVQVIESAGRKPNVPGGGELDTVVANEGYSY